MCWDAAPSLVQDLSDQSLESTESSGCFRKQLKLDSLTTVDSLKRANTQGSHSLPGSLNFDEFDSSPLSSSIIIYTNYQFRKVKVQRNQPFYRWTLNDTLRFNLPHH